jgi:hypothetical protein
MRRVIIFALVVNLAAVALSPALVCVLPPSQVAKIETAKTQTQCDGMDMQMGVQDAAPHFSIVAQPIMPCCMVSQAPQPRSQSSSGKTLVPIARLSAMARTQDVLVTEQQVPAVKPQDFSPPKLQSLLCVFLV